MPVHAFVDDRHLQKKKQHKKKNNNSIGYFAPDMRYCASGTIKEFKSMVKRQHTEGIEGILDVVYNHTAEGSHFGPTLSFRGIDNAAYFSLSADNTRFYIDYTRCGNTLNKRHPRVLQLIMVCLCFWVFVLYVDGIRFVLLLVFVCVLFLVVCL